MASRASSIRCRRCARSGHTGAQRAAARGQAAAGVEECSRPRAAATWHRARRARRAAVGRRARPPGGDGVAAPVRPAARARPRPAARRRQPLAASDRERPPATIARRQKVRDERRPARPASNRPQWRAARAPRRRAPAASSRPAPAQAARRAAASANAGRPCAARGRVEADYAWECPGRRRSGDPRKSGAPAANSVTADLRPYGSLERCTNACAVATADSRARGRHFHVRRMGCGAARRLSILAQRSAGYLGRVCGAHNEPPDRLGGGGETISRPRSCIACGATLRHIKTEQLK